MTRAERRWRATNWIMICAQLIGTRGRQLLADIDLPPAQFAMLNHFSHRPEREQRVSEIAAAFEVNQPAVSKTLQKLVRKGLVAARPGEADRRERYHRVTAAGLAAHQAALARFEPDLARVFAGWSTADLEAFDALLSRLKDWLDANRALGPAAAAGELGFGNALSLSASPSPGRARS